MTIFVSRRPNHDTEPWVILGDTLGGVRRAAEHSAWRSEFHPRPEFDQTRDPEPWLIDTGMLVIRSGYKPQPGDPHVLLAVWRPRPEFDTPVNRVLEAYRGNSAATIWHFLASLDEPMYWWRGVGSEEIDHARAVLTRLKYLKGNK